MQLTREMPPVNRVLVTDDDPDVLFATARILKKAGFDVDQAGSGAEALEKARMFKPDLMLLDVVMPGMDGYDVCRRIKSAQDCERISVVLMSHINTDPSHKADGLDAGADDFIVRPFDSREFLSRVRSMLRTKAVERELRIQQQWMQVTLASMGDGLIATDDRERVVFMNPVAETLTGWRCSKARGRKFSDIFQLMDDATQAPVENPISRVLEQGRTIRLEGDISLVRQDRHHLSISDSAAPIREPGNGIIGGVMVFQDVTEQKRSQAKRRELERQLRQTQKLEAIGTLAGGIAHDFNNILSSIIGFAELSLEEVAPDTLLADNLNEIFTAGTRARDLVRQILTFARQTEEQAEPMEIGPIIKEAVKFLRSSTPSSIDITLDIRSDGRVIAEPTRIHQVFMNLCTNAVQAMEQNGGRLDIEVQLVTVSRDHALPVPDMQPGEYVRIKVSDTGCGIPPEIRERIFEPYVTTKTAEEGTGLGLSTVHGIVTSCQGQIVVDSYPGEGARFFVYLPTTHYLEEMAAREAPQDMPRGSEHILFVDDELAVAKMGTQVMQRLGYRVTTRISSLDALDLFKSDPSRFDLVITDMTMPHMTGDELASELREIRPDLPVILCTGFSKKIVARESRMADIDAIFFKPISKADMAQTIRRVLDGLPKNRKDLS